MEAPNQLEESNASTVASSETKAEAVAVEESKASTVISSEKKASEILTTAVDESSKGDTATQEKDGNAISDKPVVSEEDLPLYMTISGPARAGVVFSLILALFLATLDQNIVIVSLPKIIREFGHPELLSWVIAAYMLTSSALMALYGRFSDVFGRKLIYLGALGFFMLGSIICGASVSIWMLIVGRGIQGMGGGGLMSLCNIILGDAVAPADRPKYMSSLSSIMAISSVVGPLLGGFFTDKVSWRWVFWINLPLAGTGFLVSLVVMKFDKRHKNLPLDIFGSFLIACASICAILFTTWGGQQGGYPWNSGVIIGLMEATVVFLMIFIWQEMRHPLPILNLSLYKDRSFSFVCAVAFMMGGVLFGTFSYLPVYFQEVQGNSATMSGLKLTPMVGGMLIGVMVSGGVLTKTGRFSGLIPVGSALLAAGVGMLIHLGVDTKYGYVVAALLLVGIGMGFVMPVLTTFIQNTVPLAEMANGMSSMTFCQMIGGAIGIAILGALLTKYTDIRLVQTLNPTESVAYAIDRVYIGGTAFALISFVLSFGVKSVQLFKPGEAKPAMELM